MSFEALVMALDAIYAADGWYLTKQAAISAFAGFLLGMAFLAKFRALNGD
jgi:hypothetical protein